MPWVNTFAIGRGDARVWFADIGPMPNVPDALVDTCTTPAGRAFAGRVPGVPFLDGSKSACAWRVDRSAVQAGALPVDADAEHRARRLRRQFQRQLLAHQRERADDGLSAHRGRDRHAAVAAHALRASARRAACSASPAASRATR